VFLILIFIQCFCTDPLYIDDLETLLDEGVLAFNLQIEDGSVEEVAIFLKIKLFISLILQRIMVKCMFSITITVTP
jgi:hypothetical protein